MVRFMKEWKKIFTIYISDKGNYPGISEDQTIYANGN